MNYSRLTRREMIAIIKALGALSVVSGCKDDSQSDIKDLTNSTSLTQISEARKSEIVQKYGIAQWVDTNNLNQDEVFTQLAAVPDVYLAFLQKRAQEVDFKIYGGGDAAGMCYFDGVGATKITLNSPIFATIHEVGHGVETHAHKLQGIGNITDLRERTYQSVTSSAEAQYIREYSKKNSKELFADGFSSFYRSPKSRADMQKMPLTYQWLKTILVCPVNLGPGENASDYIPSNGTGGTPSTVNSAAVSTTDQNIVPTTTTPTSSTVPATGANGSNLCASPTNQLIALICQLSSQIGSGGGLNLTEGNAILMPSVGQFLTAYDQFLLMAKLTITSAQANRVQVYLNKTLIQTGLEPDKYAGDDRVFSTLFTVPTAMTTVSGTEYKIMSLSLHLDGKQLLGVPVKVSRYSICGDIGDFKKQS